MIKCIVSIMYTYEPRDRGSNHKDLHRFKQDTITELRSEHKILPLIKKLFAIDTCLENKIIFSPRELFLESQITLDDLFFLPLYYMSLFLDHCHPTY